MKRNEEKNNVDGMYECMCCWWLFDWGRRSRSERDKINHGSKYSDTELVGIYERIPTFVEVSLK